MGVRAGVPPKECEYLTFMYRRRFEEGKRTTTSVLARSFEVNPATVTETLQRLSAKKLVYYTRYYGAELTKSGSAKAQELLRKHRILEVLLVKFLDYTAEKACEEASKIDYYCSQDLVNTICRAYGHPETCPCNKKIFRDPQCVGTRNEA